MTVHIEAADVVQVRRLIAASKPSGLSQRESQALDISLAITSKVWIGLYDGEAACAWGLMPPTLLSDQAHLWLYTTDLIKDHEFLFVRYSQRVLEVILEEYPRIIGLTDPQMPGAMRWLRWLGASFGEPQGKYVPFTIRKK